MKKRFFYKYIAPTSIDFPKLYIYGRLAQHTNSFPCSDFFIYRKECGLKIDIKLLQGYRFARNVLQPIVMQRVGRSAEMRYRPDRRDFRDGVKDLL